MSASRMACLEENERYSPGPAMPAPLPISLVLTAGDAARDEADVLFSRYETLLAAAIHAW